MDTGDNRREFEEKLYEYNTLYNKITASLDKIENCLTFIDDSPLNASEELRNTIKISEELMKKRKEIFTLDIDFSVEEKKDINSKRSKTMDSIRRINDLTFKQYNYKVNYVNKKIEELKNKEGLSEELSNKITSLNLLKELDVFPKLYNDTKYYDKETWDKTEEIIKEVNDIYSEIFKDEKKEEDILDSQIEGLQEDVVKFKDRIDNILSLSDDDRKKLEKELKQFTNIFNYYKEFSLPDYIYVKYENNEEKINKYEELFSNFEKVVNHYNEVFSKTKNERGQLEFRLDIVNDRIGVLSEAIYNSFRTDDYKVGDNLKTWNNNYEEISNEIKDIEDKIKNSDKLPNDVKNNLFNDIDKYKKSLNELYDKMSALEDLNNKDRMDKRLNDFEKEINSLKKDIESFDKSDKKAKKHINKRIRILNRNLMIYNISLLKVKKEEPEKYESLKSRYDKIKEDYSNVKKDFRGKCPLKVTKVKSAKDLLSKHKKILLIGAGLIAFALLSYHVLIPAIIQGFNMIGFTTPALKPITDGFNKILTGFIGGRINQYEQIILANGSIINPSAAKSSLLKGIAISGINSTLLITPILKSISLLGKKMDVKQKIVEGYTKGTTVVKNTVGNVSNKVKNSEFVQNIVQKKEEKKYDKLLAKYFSSDDKSKTIEEFFKDDELSDEDINILNKKAEAYMAIKNKGRLK